LRGKGKTESKKEIGKKVDRGVAEQEISFFIVSKLQKGVEHIALL
jgi:hypothetical protein